MSKEEQKQIQQQIEIIEEISRILQTGFRLQIEQEKYSTARILSNALRKIEQLFTTHQLFSGLKYKRNYVELGAAVAEMNLPIADIAKVVDDYVSKLQAIIIKTQSQLKPVGCKNKFKNFLNKALDTIASIFKSVSRLSKETKQSPKTLDLESKLKLTKRRNALIKALDVIKAMALKSSSSNSLNQAPTSAHQDKPRN